MKVPKSWDDISIERYVSISEELERGFKTFDDKINLIAKITGKTVKEVKQNKVPDFTRAIASLVWLNNLPDKKTPHIFKVSGYKFKVRYSITDYNGGEFIDLMKHKENPNKNMHKMLAVICEQKRTILKRRKLSRKEKEQLFYESLSMGTAYPIALFFSKLLRASLRATLTYLGKKAVKRLRNMRKDGVGLSSSVT